MLSFNNFFIFLENIQQKLSVRNYFKNINKIKINENNIRQVESLYKIKIKNDTVKKIISSNQTTFLDNEWRVLSFNDILNAEKELRVNFKSKKLLPLIDCYDNNFIVYNFVDQTFSMFNITDETMYNKGHKSLTELV